MTPVSAADLGCLYNARDDRYQGVYEYAHRPGLYFTVIGGHYLGTTRNPVECARRVVRWYKDRYGYLWAVAAKKRRNHTLPHAVRRVTDYWVVDVWVAGVKVRVGTHYPCRDIANAARRAFCRRLSTSRDREGRTSLLAV